MKKKKKKICPLSKLKSVRSSLSIITTGLCCKLIWSDLVAKPRKSGDRVLPTATERPGCYFNFNEQLEKVCIPVPFPPFPFTSSIPTSPLFSSTEVLFPLKTGTKFPSEMYSLEIVLHSVKGDHKVQWVIQE